MCVCVLGCVQAKPYRRVDYSHSSVQLMKIAHDNQLLVNHLTTISKAVSNRRQPPMVGKLQWGLQQQGGRA